MAKWGVTSVENLVFRKFPNVCPYCRQTPHQERVCKTVKGESTVNHDELREKYRENIGDKPKGLNDWQDMFQDIYPRNTDDKTRSAIGLMEELGELAEAVRVFDRHPQFLAGEAADIFSYIMGLANEYTLKKETNGEDAFDFQDAYLSRYPGLCVACGNTVCTCPSVPKATIGRMAKELDLEPDDNLFTTYFPDESGSELCNDVLNQIGGLESVISQIPLDRGQVSNSMVILLLRLQDEIKDANPELSAKLKESAINISNQKTEPGEIKSDAGFNGIINLLAKAYKEAMAANPELNLSQSSPLALSIAKAAAGIFRVLMVGVSPNDETRIKFEKELNGVKQAIKQAKHRAAIRIDELVGCSVDDLRRQLLEEEYDFIHFFGHGFNSGITLADAENNAKDVKLDSLRDLISSAKTVPGVLLNSCDSLKDVSEPLGKFTIGMNDEVDDEHAVSFAVGFYDAIGAGETVERAITEGTNNVSLQHEGAEIPIIVLT